jgi:small subunit ribosomal protein S1
VVSKPKSSLSKEPSSMAELLAVYGATAKGFSRGQKIKAKITSISSRSVVLDIGGKSEGLVTEKAFAEARDFIKTLKVGDEVIASVLIPENPEGYVILSLREAASEASWQRLEKAKKENTSVVVFVKGVNPSGVTIDVEGILGFIPNSQLGKEVAKNTQGLIGKYIKAVPLEVDKSFNKVVLSEKEVSEKEDIMAVRQALANIKEGEIYSGEVTTVANFGCFVKIEVGAKGKKVEVEGLVHVSEMAWGKVDNPAEVVSEGQKVKVKVVGLKDGKLALSMKQAEKDPWEEAIAKYKPETKVLGKVSKMSDYGAFVELEPGIEGLVHLTKIPPGTRLSEGQEVNVYVEEVDSKARKLSLGLILTTKPVGYK